MDEARIISIKAEPRDIFVHLLAIVTLYASAVGFIVLLFSYINIYFPDVLTNNPYLRQSEIGSIRWSIATLVVVFPVYILTTRYLNKDYGRNPDKRNLRIRKWLTYFTLFAAALIIIGDLVTLIFNFLGGEITARFIFKVLTVLFVAISIFYYYLWDIRTVHKEIL